MNAKTMSDRTIQKKKRMIVTGEMKHFLDLVENTSQCIFLTGKAGTGKSSLLRMLLARTSKQIVVAAPTGVAAVNVGGVTLHSLFQLPFGPFIPNIDLLGYTHDALPAYKFSSEKAEVLQNMEVLVIDEVSMLRADVLDAINDVLCHVRNNPLPFGGVQVVFIGDLYQLPPVVNKTEWKLLSSVYQTPFFFSSKALVLTELRLVCLTHIFRQTDDNFISLLNDVRCGKLSDSSRRLLNALYKPGIDASELEDGFVMLTTHNAKADKVNQDKLDELSTQQQVFTASVKGNFSASAMPAEFELCLKIGAKVMFLANDNEAHLYHNGSTGVVVSFKKNSVYVRLDSNGIEIEVLRHKWVNNKYEYNSTSKMMESVECVSFSQLPLRLAWAVTIHKSQGMTFDKLVVDAKASFSPGQVYVALSRATGTKNLTLSSPILPETLSVDPQILNFFNSYSYDEQTMD